LSLEAATRRIEDGPRAIRPEWHKLTMSEQQTGNPGQAQPASPAWINVERARHPQRPYPMNFIEQIFTDFSEIHGDRAFGDDDALASGMAR
jgi:acetyl-CoA carboxylase carboxyl transferase subunit alpha